MVSSIVFGSVGMAVLATGTVVDDASLGLLAVYELIIESVGKTAVSLNDAKLTLDEAKLSVGEVKLSVGEADASKDVHVPGCVMQVVVVMVMQSMLSGHPLLVMVGALGTYTVLVEQNIGGIFIVEVAVQSPFANSRLVTVSVHASHTGILFSNGAGDVTV